MSIQSEIAHAEIIIRAAGLSVQQFCEKQGISRASWGRYKAGKFIPRADRLEDIRHAVGKLRPKKAA